MRYAVALLAFLPVLFVQGVSWLLMKARLERAALWVSIRNYRFARWTERWMDRLFNTPRPQKMPESGISRSQNVAGPG